MKTCEISFLLIAVIVMAFFSGCNSEAETQPKEVPVETRSVPEKTAPAETPPMLEEAAPSETSSTSRSEQPVVATTSTKTNQGFSFWGNQIDIESLPEYVPHKNVLFSIRNLSEAEKEFYIQLAQIYQYLHSGNFDFVSAYQQSVSSNEFDSDVFAVFDFTAPAGKTISDFTPIIDLFSATQADILYLDIQEISNAVTYSVDVYANSVRAGEERITFGIRLSSMHQLSATVDGLNESIIKHNEYIEDFYRELRGKIPPDATRYEIVKTIYNTLIDRVEYDYSLSAIGGTIAGAVTPYAGSVYCNGYARALFYYLSRFDIPVLIVFGNEYADASISIGHVWNYVQMDDEKWYLLDATWDGANEDNHWEYFLIGDRATSATHVSWPLSSLENIALEYYNYPLPDATVYKVDSQLSIGGSFGFPNLDINYDDYAHLVYIADFSILDFRDIRSMRISNDASISELFVNDEGHVFTQIPATMRSYFSGIEFNTSGKYITIILIHHVTGERITIVFINPIK